MDECFFYDLFISKTTFKTSSKKIKIFKLSVKAWTKKTTHKVNKRRFLHKTNAQGSQTPF